jgi:DNA-binding CsgD family transcriptional regulator
MIDLYTFLHRREKMRGETVSCLIRIGLTLPLLIEILVSREKGGMIGWLVLSALAAYSLTLFLVRKTKVQPLLSTLSIITDSLLLSGALFYGDLLEPGVLSSSPLLFIYPLIIYFSFLRSDEHILLLTVILNVILYNSAFLIGQGFNPHLENSQFMDLLGAQLFRTLVLVIFGLALLDQSRRIKTILRNQNDYYEKVRKRNQPLLENLNGINEKYGLSKREAEVLKELIKGKTYRTIGEELFVSLDTVKSHVKSIYRKTGLKSRNEVFQKLHKNI